MKKFSLVLFGFLIAVGGCSFIKQTGLDDTRERIEGLEAANRELRNEVDFLHERVKTLEQCVPPPAPAMEAPDLGRGTSCSDEERKSNKAMVRRIAIEEGVNPNMLVAVAKCESGFCHREIGDGGASLGIMQIKPRYHRVDVWNAEESVRYAAREIRAGRGNAWTCYTKYMSGGHHKKHRRHRGPR